MVKVTKIDEELYDRIVGIIYLNSLDYQKKFDNDFRKVLDACLNDYLGLIKEHFVDIFYYAQVVINCDYMNRIVKSFLQGRHSTAFKQLKNVLKENNDMFVVDIDANETFYRMRSFDKRKGLRRTDLFHIPITQKRIIQTQRYSAPGYPCLYLGKSIYVCWEEMQRPDTETTLVSCFKSQNKLRVLDMRIPTLFEFFDDAEKYILSFPFIIAAGIPVCNSKDIFKPEYIIPQLILEWVIENNSNKKETIYGVYYTSVNRNEDFYWGLDHEWDNLAIPVQTPLSEEAYCPKLKQLFYCTRPTCYEYEFILGNINNTGHWDGGPKRRDSDGMKNDYYRSVFSRMEELLEKRSFNVIDTDEPE